VRLWGDRSEPEYALNPARFAQHHLSVWTDLLRIEISWSKPFINHPSDFCSSRAQITAPLSGVSLQVPITVPIGNSPCARPKPVREAFCLTLLEPHNYAVVRVQGRRARILLMTHANRNAGRLVMIGQTTSAMSRRRRWWLLTSTDKE
jgi:hypothetical protein